MKRRQLFEDLYLQQSTKYITGVMIGTLISGTDQTAQKHPYKYGQLIFAKFLRQFSEERMVFSTNDVDMIGYP